MTRLLPVTGRTAFADLKNRVLLRPGGQVGANGRGLTWQLGLTVDGEGIFHSAWTKATPPMKDKLTYI